MNYLIGLDIGTGGARALLLAETGEVAAAAAVEYPLSTPRPLWAEQDPEDWQRPTVQPVVHFPADS